MKRLTVLAVALGFGGLALTACGSDGPATSSIGGSNEVELTMVDIGFEPDAVEVPAGEEITFSFTNDGKLEHEALIGTQEEQEDHEVEMNGEDMSEMSEDEMANMDDDGHGDSAEAITVEPGESAELTHTFDEPGEYMIGCHVSGHWAAGMKVTVTVT